MSIKLSTMMLAKDQVYLVHLQLIDDQYPLYGALEVNSDTRIPENGVWVDSVTDSALGRKLEELVLTRAREIRAAGITETNN